MEYAGFLRGDSEEMNWADVTPLTQDSIFGSQIPSGDVQCVEAPGDVAPGGGRGSSYRVEEDLLLVGAWLQVSMDPVVGTNQSLGAFWQRVESFYHENKTFTSTRNRKSLQGRWTFINGMVQKFCGHYARAQRNRRSGTTEAEMVVEACKMFQAAEHKEFTMLPCWRELRDHPKWQVETSRKRQKTSAAASPSSTPNVASFGGLNGAEDVDATTSNAGDRAKRPPGRTRSKEARGTSSSSSASAPMTDLFDRQLAMKDKIEKERAERFAELMDVERRRLRLEEERMKMELEKEQQRLRLEAERMQMEKEKEERNIMSMDLSQMDEDQQAYYKSLRQSIIAARRVTGGPSS
ncbi:glutathione S-transferase T3-like [Phragmites australis]|uniref:glutathione S-transferase T3-like n=1 Tax=Phragmites australis TaxID=29695 RepID=UPI002D77DBCA|nr:glutathione S-transferase T3-like [Phragmites australis]